MKSAFSTFCKLLLLHTATNRYKGNNMSYNSPIIQKMAASGMVWFSKRPLMIPVAMGALMVLWIPLLLLSFPLASVGVLYYGYLSLNKAN